MAPVKAVDENAAFLHNKTMILPAIKRKIASFRTRCGDLWWYALLVFAACRLADLVNAFVAIFLVQKYVPEKELGAVLPLEQVGLFLGVPLSILLLPFSKYLNRYATQGEWGKVKKLLRDVFVLSGAVFLIMLGVAHFLLPLVFERMRVENGRLSLLIVTSGILTALLPIFTSALQALKRFSVISANNVVSAPLRLITMLIAGPFRGLSGYFVGKIVPALYCIGATCYSLRRLFSKDIAFESYLRKDFGKILRFSIPVAFMICLGTFQIGVETFVIRHRLPDASSAEFYIISRFAEWAASIGAALILVIFPLVAERHEQGRSGLRLAQQAMIGTTFFGGCIALVLWLLGDLFFSWIPSLNVYVGSSAKMGFLAIVYTLRAGIGVFTNYELASGRFRFLVPWGVVIIIETLLLYCLNGYTFFYGILPDTWVDAMGSVNAGRLSFVLGMMFAASFFQAACCLLILRKQRTALN